MFLYCSGGERRVKCVRLELEMETSKEEQSSVVHFLVAEGAGTREIHRRTSSVYGEHCMTLTSVHEWLKGSHEGRTSLQYDSCQGQAHRAIKPNVIVWIDGLIREYRRITEDQMRVQIGFRYVSVHAFIKYQLHSRKNVRAVDSISSDRGTND